jgi:hypothetical protein
MLAGVEQYYTGKKMFTLLCMRKCVVQTTPSVILGNVLL